MSAIAGWIAASRQAPEAAAAAPMLAALAHRGAAGEGVCEFVNRGTGHRVAIAQRGPQPCCDAPSGVALAFDGAIDNRKELRGKLELRGYGFEDAGDAELVLRAYQHWDKDVVKQLRGHFAFALWDARKERLLLARDRFGEKPLYLHERDGGLYFASEIKALLRIPGAKAGVDPRALQDYLARRYVPGPRTLFAGVRKLPPATYALWQFGKLREVRYWSLPDGAPRPAAAAAPDAVERFVTVLEESVKLQSERGRCGVFLSGGLDSAVLVALASRHRSKLPTFSLGFAGDRKSELPYAAQVAKQFGTEHREIVLEPQDLPARLARLVALRDAPMALPSDLAVHALACEAAGSVTTVLTGEGCDELLGGYRRYVAARFWRPAGERKNPDALGLFFERSSCLTENPENHHGHNGSSLRRMLHADQAGWLADNLLERGERMTAAAALEARMPFLDYRLAEYVSSLPDEARVSGLSTKRILRQAARGLLRELPRRRKSGFRVPLAQWLRGGLREALADHLQSGESLTRPYYEIGALDRAIDQHLKGRHNHDTLLWTLLNLEIWHRTYARA